MSYDRKLIQIREVIDEWFLLFMREEAEVEDWRSLKEIREEEMKLERRRGWHRNKRRQFEN